MAVYLKDVHYFSLGIHCHLRNEGTWTLQAYIKESPITFSEGMWIHRLLRKAIEKAKKIIIHCYREWALLSYIPRNITVSLSGSKYLLPSYFGPSKPTPEHWWGTCQVIGLFQPTGRKSLLSYGSFLGHKDLESSRSYLVKNGYKY